MGRLFIVGFGPGDPLLRTYMSVDAIRRSNVVIGYNTYVDLISDLLNGKEVMRFNMREELKRAEAALTHAFDLGENVALVSDGDPQVYGMASPTLELACMRNYDMDQIEVVPGVTAALAAASRLGAPLSMDFAVISLSDLLIPRSEILSRVRHAAEGDFVIVFYNLINKELLINSMDIITRYRSPSTPVGIAKSVYRQGENVVITSLAQWRDYLGIINMQSTIIVGNSKTYVCRGRMITPRGYTNKYVVV
ncbi:precorrin-3B C(17)-methyltransferase [Vulcanisaeta sp. JCM 16161]|uniref:precorrin-3B C(17)-methyltransferase n=1 Tax=Vulcanisaeta sp. JCM 16161 TaxID=1295372 RepID=UPI0006CFE141|nr:precorrin-3B C(17)-methyltransferase [Vulcanisaeta sp. JCM 16161]